MSFHADFNDFSSDPIFESDALPTNTALSLASFDENAVSLLPPAGVVTSSSLTSLTLRAVPEPSIAALAVAGSLFALAAAGDQCAIPEPATRSSWKLRAFTGTLEPLSYEDSLSAPEFATLRCGLVPVAMEDRWFVFYEDPVLFFHRSWTGMLIFQVELAASEGGVRVARASVAREQSAAPGTQFEADLLRFIVRAILLGQEVSLPRLSKRRHG